MTQKTKQRPDEYYKWAVPPSLEISPDPLRIRLDFHDQAVAMHLFDKDGAATVKMVSAMDVAHALARELSFSTGLLPANTLWWTNTPHGAMTALWEEPRVRRLALQEQALKPPRRFTIPLPGLIFLCQPGQAPWVYAVRRKPTKLEDRIYRAPFCNVYESGRTCPGTHKYPQQVHEIPDSFFRSFFSPGGNMDKRSILFPHSVIALWEFLNGKKEYPLDDLVQHGTVGDLMNLNVKGW